MPADLRKRLARFPRMRRALLPTPVHRLDGLSRELGLDIWCKRDDLTGFGFGGNKARKLDFLLAEALARGADTLVAAGGRQSNFCRMAAAYGAASGLEVHLVLGGGEAGRATGNLLLVDLLGVRRRHLPTDDWAEWEAEAARLEKELTGAGRKVYRMPVGGSVPTGALGYAEAVAEIMEDEKRLGLRFDAMVHASSSAGTQAGLLAGRAAARWPGRVLGINVAKPPGRLANEVFVLAAATGELLGARPDRGDVAVDDSFLGEGYARPAPWGEEALALFARLEGIFLDRVYTAKAAAALVALACRRDPLLGKRVLFIHTGGAAELFA